ncbi:MAG: hypothetical protein QUS08_03560 [Methanothrix sp.]|nr:hypothetical protein [Methanothrix sp.]
MEGQDEGKCLLGGLLESRYMDLVLLFVVSLAFLMLLIASA